MSTECQLVEGIHIHKDSCVLLCDGNRMPVIGLGTFNPDVIPEGEGFKSLRASENTERSEDGSGAIQTAIDLVREATKAAIDIGYRHVDGAYVYLTEPGIGEAFREKMADGTVKREDLFYTSKLWSTFHQPELVRPALEKSLESLQLDYIDLYIIHWPISFKPGELLFPTDENGTVVFDQTDLLQTWEALEACKDAGLVKSIGVSNFNRRQLESILNKPGLKHKPVCNQVECHPYLNQKEMLEFCKLKNIVVVAYGVLGSPGGGSLADQSCPNLLENPVLTSIAQKYKQSPAQISIRYILQRGAVAIVKSFNPERMKQNLQVYDFCLTPEDMKAIDGLNRNVRYWKLAMLSAHPQYPFHSQY